MSAVSRGEHGGASAAPPNPKLARKVRVRFDAREGKWMLVAPERGLLLNATAARIVALCDGTRAEHEIARVLAEEFAASPEILARDVAAVLGELRARVLLEPGT